MTSPNRDIAPRKRESRAGTRKVGSLSQEQLERKRANDREAQRTIRQRTRDHIESLEQQVAELRPKAQQFEDAARRIIALEDENRRLRHEMATSKGYSDPHSSFNSPSGPSFPPHLPGPLALHHASRAPSALSTPSQVTLAPDWQHYSSTRSPSLCDSAGPADCSNRVEGYMLEGQIPATPPIAPQQPAPMSVGPPSIPGFNGSNRLPDSTGASYPQYYPTSHADDLQSHTPQPTMAYGTAPRTIPEPSVPTDSFQPPQQQPCHALGRPTSQPQYNYPWYQQS